MVDIVGKRFWYFLISGVLIVVAIVSLAVFGLRSSIEFSSGSQMSVKFASSIDYKQLESELSDIGYGNAIVQSTGDNEYLIRTKTLTADERNNLESSLSARFGQVTQTGFNSISASTASHVTRNATIAVAVAMVGMLLYVTWAFRKMPRPFRWGTCFVIALFHDIIVTVGLFSLFGHFLGWEIDLMFITGILAIVGVSLDNTIVVFDRMRENQRLGVSSNFETVVNRSQMETLGRSLNTTITIIITCLALLIFVGGRIENFVVVLLIGLIAGTYDSVFVAPGLLVVWDNHEWGRFIGRKPQGKLETAAAAKGR
jgi:preprotein translocase subunit SecF